MPESTKPNLSRRAMMQGALATAGGLAFSQSGLLAAAVQQQAKAPFPYVQAKAFHIPPIGAPTHPLNFAVQAALRQIASYWIAQSSSDGTLLRTLAGRFSCGFSPSGA
jgi:hypothetical protein